MTTSTIRSRQRYALIEEYGDCGYVVSCHNSPRTAQKAWERAEKLSARRRFGLVELERGERPKNGDLYRYGMHPRFI